MHVNAYDLLVHPVCIAQCTDECMFLPVQSVCMYAVNRGSAGGVASRLATAICVAMVMPILTILIIQMTQISNVKVIGLMVDFFYIYEIYQTLAFKVAQSSLGGG